MEHIDLHFTGYDLAWLQKNPVIRGRPTALRPMWCADCLNARKYTAKQLQEYRDKRAFLESWKENQRAFKSVPADGLCWLAAVCAPLAVLNEQSPLPTSTVFDFKQPLGDLFWQCVDFAASYGLEAAHKQWQTQKGNVKPNDLWNKPEMDTLASIVHNILVPQELKVEVQVLQPIKTAHGVYEMKRMDSTGDEHIKCSRQVTLVFLNADPGGPGCSHYDYLLPEVPPTKDAAPPVDNAAPSTKDAAPPTKDASTTRTSISSTTKQ